MANPDALARLMTSVPEWNRWRDDLLDKNDFSAIDIDMAT